MANDNITTIETEKVPMQTQVELPVKAAIESLAVTEERSLSNMMARLLKTHPQVAEVLETQTAGAGA